MKMGIKPKNIGGEIKKQMLDGGYISLESGFKDMVIDELEKKGHTIKYDKGVFGGYQAIMKINNVYFGASESRKDGQASGY